MPVCIKSEPRKSSASQQLRPQPPPAHSLSSNGSTPTPSVQMPATGISHNDGTGASRTSSASQPCTTAASSSSIVQSANGTAAEKEKAAAVSEDAIDYDSVRGVFGWATLDEVNVPYIIRKGKRFVAVRIVEKKVLNKYPNSFPDELGRKEPLVSYFVTEAEAALLNEINTDHCSFEYGHQPFTTKDLIVDLVEFEDFYKLVKKTFPDNVLAAITATENAKGPNVDERKALLSKVCGWMQINNTVTPYILRSLDKYVPLSVIQYAAQLLTKEQVEGHLPTAEECEFLNDTCRAAGFDFTFGRNTKLLHIAEVMQRCQVKIFELPFENPLQHAQYIDSLNQGEAASGQPSPLIGPSGIVGSMALPFQSRPVFNEGPPNLNPFTPYNPFMSMMNMISQAPTSASNHLVSRTAQLPPPRAMTAGPQLSLVRTQNAPIFYPPAGPASQSRNPQMNQNPAAPIYHPPTAAVSQSRNSLVNKSSVTSQTSTIMQGAHNKTSLPPAVGATQGHGSSSPQGRIGTPMGSSAYPSQLQAHGGVGIPNAGQLAHVSSPSSLARFPPPNYPVASQPRQPLTRSPINSPPAQHGPSPHPFMPSSRLTTDTEMVMPGAGPVPRGAGPGAAFPTSGMPPGGLPAHMNIPQPSAQPQQHPPHSQPHPLPQYNQLQSHRGAPVVRSQMPNNSANQVSARNHPNLPTSNASLFPAQLTPGAPQSQGSAGRLPNLESVSKSRTAPDQTRGPDDHLKLVGDIRAEMVNGKSISCMKRNSVERTGSFCLVEAVAKLYFPRCSLSEFVKALQNVLGISLPVCTEPEAKAFIHFYNLPVARLNDNHMISLQDLKNYFPQISYMFQHAAVDASSISGQFLTSGTRRSTGSEGATKLASPSTPIAIVLNNNDSSEVINVDSGSPTPSADSSRKRKPGEAGVISSKYNRHSLDQRVPYRVDEVDGNVTTLTVNELAPSTTTSQVIVID